MTKIKYKILFSTIVNIDYIFYKTIAIYPVDIDNKYCIAKLREYETKNEK